MQEVTPQPTIIGLVAAGIGVSCVSSSLQSINRPGVVYRELDVLTPELELVAAWKIEKVSPVLLISTLELDSGGQIEHK